jgi:hypothetical protein
MAVGRGTETASQARASGRPRAATSLSVCCMTSGRRPTLLAGVLAPLREIASEIVVAVEAPRAAEVHAAVEGLVDSVLAFQPTAPADRPIAWLFRSCSARWILNVDDDEVPSPALVRALPAILARRDITHAWIARRWVYPTRNTYIASAPWGTEFQLRLMLADERFVQFSDVFHRPVVCHGPSAYVEEPLWHLDTLLNPAAHRRRKAAAYERERPGMEIAGLAHNLGLYVPELHPGLELAEVPGDDRTAIMAAQSSRQPPDTGAATIFVEYPAEAVDQEWVGPPYGDDLYRGEVSFRSAPTLLAGAQSTVDVHVTNGSDRVWRWGPEARPAVMLAYRWRRGGAELADGLALRTSLPVDIPPGATEVVPVHVVAPSTPGRYELEVDLVHEGVRRFERPAVVEVDVRAQRRIAVIAPPARVPEIARELSLPPDVELVAVLRDPVDGDAYGDYGSVVGLRPYLLAGTARRGRLRTLARLLVRLAAVLSSSPDHWARPGYRALLELRDGSDVLLVDSPNWDVDAAFGREWAWVSATALLWRRGGKPAYLRAESVPGGNGMRERVVRALLHAVTKPS